MESSAKGSSLMGVQGVGSRDRPVSARRIVAIAVSVGCHLGLLLVLLRPATPNRTYMTAAVVNDEAALQVRFIAQTQRASRLLVPRLAAHAPGVAREAPAKERMPPAAPRVTQVAASPREAESTDGSPTATASNTPAEANQDTNFRRPMGDGGFLERMRNAQHSQDLPGVPGSDRPIAPDLELTHPMDQGIGSVMRNTQRLFGVTDRHCIDVEVWQHLSPDELKERHLTAADLAKESDKYNCNRPLGLNF
jgi:hypothetical protein